MDPIASWAFIVGIAGFVIGGVGLIAILILRRGK